MRQHPIQRGPACLVEMPLEQLRKFVQAQGLDKCHQRLVRQHRFSSKEGPRSILIGLEHGIPRPSRTKHRPAYATFIVELVEAERGGVQHGPHGGSVSLQLRDDLLKERVEIGPHDHIILRNKDKLQQVSFCAVQVASGLAQCLSEAQDYATCHCPSCAVFTMAIHHKVPVQPLRSLPLVAVGCNSFNAVRSEYVSRGSSDGRIESVLVCAPPSARAAPRGVHVHVVDVQGGLPGPHAWRRATGPGAPVVRLPDGLHDVGPGLLGEAALKVLSSAALKSVGRGSRLGTIGTW
mmetsp:Transcript_131118/g.365420  ORF Transcript_131118/g.365420 Transcript_131118/m.365420 type:complete len:292 (+) Transcript_131118:127-1002(+)